MLRKFIAFALLAVLAFTPTAVVAQDSTVFSKVYLDQNGDRLNVKSGGTVIGPFAQHIRSRFTIAQVNAGATVLAAVTGAKYRIIDVGMIAVGGAVATCTTVDVLATQSTAVKIVANAVAALTENTLLRAGASNSTILAAGASFVQNDVSTAVTIGKTGSSCATATHVDLLLTYALEF